MSSAIRVWMGCSNKMWTPGTSMLKSIDSWNDNNTKKFYPWILKGSLSGDFRPLFFSWFETIWAPDKQPKVFLNFVSISPISAVCITPLRWSLYTPQRWSQRYATQRRDDLRGVQQTAEINCTPRKQNRILHLSRAAFKETIRRNPFQGEHIYHERKDLKYKMLIY